MPKTYEISGKIFQYLGKGSCSQRINLQVHSLKKIAFLSCAISFIIIIIHEANLFFNGLINVDNKIFKKLESYIWDRPQTLIPQFDYDALSATSPQFNNNSASNSTLRVLTGTCSMGTSPLGDHQRVISYSLLNTVPGYSKGLNEIINTAYRLYPGWQVRIYASGRDITYLKTFVKERDFVVYCDIDKILSPLKTLRPYPVTIWRYAVLGDPQIDVAIFRDTDSDIIQREVDAVQDWLKSNKSLHIMRDHPSHDTTILAGMWGIKMNEANRKLLQKLRNRMFAFAYYKTDLNIDQPYLAKIFWPHFEEDSLSHDSFHCEKYTGSLPWPTQRNAERRYVGGIVYRDPIIENYSLNPKFKCPERCRPKHHRDWEYC